MNDAHSTLTFTGIHQPLYNVALDGVVYQYDGNYPQDQNPLFILWVSGTDEASTAPRQAGSGRRPRERHAAWCARWIFRRGGYPDPASGGL